MIACGVWSPRIAEMAGATIPLTPAVHQMADVGPIEILQKSGKEVAYPIVRDMDTFCYERQTGRFDGSRLVRPPPDLHAPERHPVDRGVGAVADRACRSPMTTSIRRSKQALELMGEILETAEIRYAINGLLSLTPDAMPVLGETIEVRNLWSAAAVWIKEGPGIAKLVAEWMTYGYPHMCDPHSSDISRFYPHERTEHHIEARCAEHFNKTYGIVHPREQWASERGMRRSPFYARERSARRDVLRRPRLGTPAVVRVERHAAREVSRRLAPRDRTSGTPAGGRRSSTPSTSRCASSVGMVDLTAFNEFDITGPGALDVPAVHDRQQRRRRRRPLGVHPAAHPARRLPCRPHDPCASATSTSASSPAPSTVAATATGSSGTCRPTAR